MYMLTDAVVRTSEPRNAIIRHDIHQQLSPVVSTLDKRARSLLFDFVVVKDLRSLGFDATLIR